MARRSFVFLLRGLLRLFRLCAWRPFAVARLLPIRPRSATSCPEAGTDGCLTSRGSAASWLFNSRRQVHFLLGYRTVAFVLPNVRAKRPAAAGRLGPD